MGAGGDGVFADVNAVFGGCDEVGVSVGVEIGVDVATDIDCEVKLRFAMVTLLLF